MKLQITALVTSLIMANVVSAATAIDLRHQPINLLQNKFFTHAANQAQMKITNTDVDFNQTTHTRMQEMVAGIPVWDATAVVHTPKKDKHTVTIPTMNGVIYEGIEKDLSSTPSYALTAEQEHKALEQAKDLYIKEKRISRATIKEETTQKIIYINKDNQARYAYLVSFYQDDGLTGAHRPTMIVDAASLTVYREWDRVRTISDSNNVPTPGVTLAGGIGGNEKIGEIVYDGAIPSGHHSALPVIQHETNIEVLPGQNIRYSMCELNTSDVVVEDVSYGSVPVVQPCFPSASHNNIVWLSLDNDGMRWKRDEVNGGYSPSLDALYGATVVQALYKNWYGVPVLTTNNGKTPMKLVMRVHYGRKFENAFWDGEQMTFGDGDRMFYPLTSLDVTAHEISHGFTTQHSNLDGDGSLAMAALHEAFSDMAAVAAQFYMNEKNIWEMGRTISKGESALRYVNNPVKDGQSIDNVKDFDSSMNDPHLVAGIYNKAFYLIATAKGWDVHKAFDVMVKANMHYWTSSMKTFEEAACGVVSATKDYRYNVADVRIAFANVGIDTSKC